MVSLRHAGFDRAGRQAGAGDLGVVDAAQVQDRGVGLPRNCAEATIKDFGVVCVDSGYELHVGGNGGIKVRATDLLCKVATEAEAMEMCAAFVQLYREEARYLERTAPWIERVGLAYIQSRLLPDEEERAELAHRFFYSQQFSQDDPWAARVAGEERGCMRRWRASRRRRKWHDLWFFGRRMARYRLGQ